MRSLKFILLLSAILALGRATIGLAEDQKPVTILRGTSAPPPPAPDLPPVGYENYGYTPGYDIPYYLPYLSAPHRFVHGDRFHAGGFHGGGFHSGGFHAGGFHSGGFHSGGGHR
jgi:uncharacterized membrane protein YgcG